jgi:dTDP-4-amino-4,6-dideoxygalactose transaminase
LISGSIVDGPDLARLKSQIIETLGVVDAVLCGSGSLALELALRACEVGKGDEVVIPTFCCSAVVPPILAVGATPVLADVGEDLNINAATVDAALTKKTKAIIVPHLFGNPAEIDAIIDLVCGKKIRVIDDAAQALGATIGGQPAGSFGDAGVLSFGSEKVCFGLGGGVLISQHQSDCRAFPLSLSRPQIWPTLRNLTTTVIRRRWRRSTLPVQKIFMKGKTKSPHEAPIVYRTEGMANLSAAAATTLVRSLTENIAARRARVRAYRELLGDVAQLTLIPHRIGSACLTQVIRISSRRRGDDASARLIGVLGAAGYEVQGSYVPLHLLSKFHQCVWDRVSRAERIWADLVELPCEPSVSLADVDRIAEIVKSTARS